MHRQKLWLLVFLLISIAFLPACVNRNSQGASSTLARGFGESSSPSAQTGEAKVIKVTPDVVAIHDGRADKLYVGMQVPTNAILRSDDKGRAAIAFSNGATINISPNSEISLASVAPAIAGSRKEEGAVKGLTRKMSDAFGQSGSPSAKQVTIGVRGLK